MDNGGQLVFLVRLIYVSSITESFTSSDIEEILHIAREKNDKNNVTGALCFSQKYFLQCLEGSRTQVNETYHRILNDKRHEKIVMLEYQEIVEREFYDWSMAYMPDMSLTRSINMKYSASPEFDPYTMSGESAHCFLSALKSSLPSV